MKINFPAKIKNKNKKQKNSFILFEKLIFLFSINNISLAFEKKNNFDFYRKNLYFLTKIPKFESNNFLFFFRMSCLVKSFKFLSHIFSRKQSFNFKFGSVRFKVAKKKKLRTKYFCRKKYDRAQNLSMYGE